MSNSFLLRQTCILHFTESPSGFAPSLSSFPGPCRRSRLRPPTSSERFKGRQDTVPLLLGNERSAEGITTVVVIILYGESKTSQASSRCSTHIGSLNPPDGPVIGPAAILPEQKRKGRAQEEEGTYPRFRSSRRGRQDSNPGGPAPQHIKINTRGAPG